MPAPLRVAFATEVVGAVARFGLADTTTLIPDITATPDSGYVDLVFEDASYEVAKEPNRADALRRGCSPFLGAAAFATYNDGSDDIPIVPGTITLEMDFTGPGSGGDWTTTAIWKLLRSRLADGGEAAAGAAGADDVINITTTTAATPATPANFRVGDIFVVPSIAGRPEATRVVDHDGTDLVMSPGLPSAPGAGITVNLTRQLYYEPGQEGDSIVFRVDGVGVRWYGLGSRLNSLSLRRDNAGRLLGTLGFEVSQWIADHSNADPSCDDCTCTAGGVAHLTNVRPAISDDFCGIGGGFGTAPHTTDRVADLELEDFTCELAITTQRRPSFGRPLGACEINSGDAECTISTKLCGRDATFDGDPAAGPASRQMLQVTSPCSDGVGVVIFMGGVQVDGLPNDPERGEGAWEQTITWKLGKYCGDVTGAVGGNAPNTNRAFSLGFVRSA